MEFVTRNQRERKSLVLDSLNPIVSTVDTFNFLHNPLFWISLLNSTKESLLIDHGQNFKISRLLIGCSVSTIETLIGCILDTFMKINVSFD